MVTERVRYRWWVLVNTLLVSSIAVSMGWTYIVTVVPPVLEDLGLTIAHWGTLWATISLWALLFAILGGAVGDRFGVRRTVGLGVVLMGAFLALRGTATGLSTMYLWMFLFGVALGFTFSNLPKALGMWFPPQELGMANGINLAGYGAGGALALVLPPLVVESLGGWRTLTSILGLLTIGLGLLWFFTVRESPVAAPGSATSMGVGEAIRRVLTVRDVWLVALCQLLFLGGWLGVIGYLPTYLVTVQGMTPPAAGAVSSMILWAFIVGCLILPTLSDRVGLRKVFYVPGILAAGLCLFLAAYAFGPLLWSVVIVWGFMAAVNSILFAVPLEMEGVGPTLAGSAVGVIMTAGYLGGFIGPLLGMRLVSARPVAGFAFWAGCYGLSSLLFLVIKETGPRRQRA